MLSKPGKQHIYTFIAVITSLLLILSWFRFGHIIAFAEEGFPFYKPDLIIEKYKYFWADTGFGQANPFYYPRLPLFYFSRILQNIGLTSWMIQAIVFFFLLLTPLLSMPKLVKELGYKKEIAYISTFFYLFNLFTISQVWGRFILPMIFLWSYLPLFTYLWIKLIKNGNPKNLVYLLLSSLFYSYAFGIPSSLLVIFIPVTLYALISVLRSENKSKKLLYVTSYFAIWILFNVWWLYPAIIVSRSSIAVHLDGGSSIESLQAVSQYYPVSEIVVLKQRFLFSDNEIFKAFYSSPFAQYVSIFILFLVVIGISSALKKYKKSLFILMLLIFGFIIVKGSNPPFGDQFFGFLFRYFPPSQVLRNPYEKAGILFLLAYSVMFALGTAEIAKFLKQRLLVYLLTSILTFLLYMQPFWKGFVFPSHAYVSVPDYYEEADNYLSQYDGRILQLPLVISDRIEYDWRYKGGQHLDQVFSNPVISDPVLVQSDPFYHSMRKNLKNENYSNLFILLRIKNIMINNDLVITNPHDIRVSESYGLVENWSNMVKDKRFEALDIYRYDGELNGRVHLASGVREVKNVEQAFETFLSDDFDPTSQAVYVSEQNRVNNIPIENYDSAPNAELVRISPEKYNVFIKDAETPYYLILSDTINSLWIASVDGEVMNGKFVANGFANGWYIDMPGSYTIEIEFKVWPWEKY